MADEYSIHPSKWRVAVKPFRLAVLNERGLSKAGKFAVGGRLDLPRSSRRRPFRERSHCNHRVFREEIPLGKLG